jgi:hypothetical protein
MPAYARSHIVPPGVVGVYHGAVRAQGVSLRCRSPDQARLRASQGMDAHNRRPGSLGYCRQESNARIS